MHSNMSKLVVKKRNKTYVLLIYTLYNNNNEKKIYFYNRRTFQFTLQSHYNTQISFQQKAAVPLIKLQTGIKMKIKHLFSITTNLLF